MLSCSGVGSTALERCCKSSPSNLMESCVRFMWGSLKRCSFLAEEVHYQEINPRSVLCYLIMIPLIQLWTTQTQINRTKYKKTVIVDGLNEHTLFSNCSWKDDSRLCHDKMPLITDGSTRVSKCSSLLVIASYPSLLYGFLDHPLAFFLAPLGL